MQKSHATQSGLLHEASLLACAVVVLGTCSDPAQLAAALRGPGYLDHAIALPAPGAGERASMLASHIAARGAFCDLAHLQVLPLCIPTLSLSTHTNPSSLCTVSFVRQSHASFILHSLLGMKPAVHHAVLNLSPYRLKPLL